MQARFIKIGIFTLGILGISVFQIKGNSSGASSPLTGAPNENTCNSCHSGSTVITSGTQFDRIRMSANFTGNGYIPDSTYTITLTYAETGKSTFGFQMTALSNGSAAGRFTSSSRTNTFSSNVSGSTRYYIEHNSSGSSSIATDSTAWTFQWRAPSSNVGEITFYVAVNSTNGNGSSSGDQVYNKTFKISPSTLLPKATAKVKSTLACAGTTIELEGSSTNSPISYEWTFPNGNPSSSNMQNPSVKYSSSGTQLALLRTFNAKGASTVDTLKISILDAAIKPNLNIRTATTVLCLGDTLDFSLVSSTKHTYIWSDGASGRNTRIDTGGWVFATATRDNGCSVTSDSVFVVAFPKPSFNIGYGLYDDTVCANEPLLIILNNKSFADSYSITGPNGPFFRDSFLIKTIQNGTNSYQFWGKSKIGCVSPASDLKNFIGIDTPNAPILKVSETFIDKIKFEWDKLYFAKNYQFSTDSGKVWRALSKDSNTQWIQLDSATQTVNFWLRAETGVLCGFSKIAKIQAKGAGCKTPELNFIISNDTICQDSIFRLEIGGLYQYKSYQLLIDGRPFMDSLFIDTIKANKTFSIEFLDSQQLICGNYDQNIEVYVDRASEFESNFKNNKTYLFCGAEDSLLIDFEINNYQDKYSYRAKINESNIAVKDKNELKLTHGLQDFQIISETATGCLSSAYNFEIIVDTLPETNFNMEWEDMWRYKISAVISDTNNYEHRWTLENNGTALTNSNNSSFSYDFSSYMDSMVTITHQLRSKLPISDTSCDYSMNKSFVVKNLITQSLKRNPIQLFPNPIPHTQYAKCSNCDYKTRFLIYTTNGQKVGDYSFEEFKNSNLPNGFYWIEFSNNQEKFYQTLIIQP